MRTYFGKQLNVFIVFIFMITEYFRWRQM